MAESIVKDKKRILPCAAYCEEKYGIGGFFVGVPCILGSNGVEQVIEIKLDENEKALMDESISHVKDLVGTVVEMFPDLA
jgi:malate dehydrogenase